MDADDRANELYWGSSRSVNRIAQELDLSKGALYEMIRPLPADLDCPQCGTEVVHPNRTAKERGRVDCPACGWDAAAIDAEAASVSRSRPRAERPDIEPADESYPQDDYDAPGPPPKQVLEREADARRIVAGGALLGAAVGLALVIWARRR